MRKSIIQKAFEDEVHRLRAAYEPKRKATNLVPPKDFTINVVGGMMRYT